MGTNAVEVLASFYKDYRTNTSQKIKIIDAYLLYILLTGINQFVYCCLVGTFPFNSFLSGFISCVASFVLGGKYISLLADHQKYNFRRKKNHMYLFSFRQNFLLCLSLFLDLTFQNVSYKNDCSVLNLSWFKCLYIHVWRVQQISQKLLKVLIETLHTFLYKIYLKGCCNKRIPI